jgi:DNA-binding beta-propeller fold protein YncE
MKRIFLLSFITVFAIVLSAQQVVIDDSLTKKWEARGELKVPESVFYDNLNQAIYVSNVTGDPSQKDNSGFISKLSTDGKVVNANWITGLNAPKGMGVIGNLLYVTDIDRVAEIDIKAGKILRFIEIPGSKFLNDIATDSQGNVYVSDSQNNTVHIIRQDKAELFVQGEKLKGINGLYVERGSLLAGLQNSMVQIDLKTKEIQDYILYTGSIDGLVPDGKGNYIISDWQGHVNIVGKGKSKRQLLDTTPVKMNAADIEYVVTKKLLLVPTFGANSVVAYELK